jgi:hypothetical protein
MIVVEKMKRSDSFLLTHFLADKVSYDKVIIGAHIIALELAAKL